MANEIGIQVGGIYYAIDLDDKKFKDKVNETTEGGLKKLQDSFKAAEAGSFALAGGLIGLGVALLGLSAIGISQFTQWQDGLAQTNAVLKSTQSVAGVTKQEVEDLAGSFQNLTKFSDDVVLSGENMLLTFTNIGQNIFPQATETMLNMSQALGQDVKSSAIQLGKALNDPILGVTALRRVGVNFTESQQTMIEKLVKSGKTLDAQKLILKELQTEFGGSAKAAGQTFTGQLTILQNKFLDMTEVVGRFIVEGLTPMLKGFNTWFDEVGGAEGVLSILVNAFQIMEPALPIIAGAILGGLVPAFVALAASVWATLAPLIPFLAIGAAIGFAIDMIVKKFGGWQPILDKVKQGIEFLTKAFGDFIAGIAQGDSDMMGQALAGIFPPGLLDKMKPLFEWLQNQFMLLGIAGKSFSETFQPFLQEIGTIINDEIMPALSDLFDAVMEVFGADTTTNLEDQKEAMKEMGRIAAVVLGEGLKGLLAIIKFVIQGITFLVDKFKELVANGENIRNNMVAIGQGVMNFFAAIPGQITGFVNSIKEALNGMVKINGIGIVDWLGSQLRGVWNVLTSVFSQLGSWLYNNVIKPFANAWDAVSQNFNIVFGNIKSVLINFFSGVGGAVGNIGSIIKGFLNTLIDKLNRTLEFGFDVPGIGKIGINLPDLPRFDKGTNFVPQDMLAMIHKGEKITPAKFNPDNPANETKEKPSITVNIELNPQGIIATSRTALRKLSSEMIECINEELRARGLPEIAGGDL